MGYKLKLTRDTDLYVLTIVDSKSGYRTEVRGKSNYETDGYDSNDALHKLLDVIGKSANISELMNSVCVSINNKNSLAAVANKALDKAFNLFGK